MKKSHFQALIYSCLFVLASCATYQGPSLDRYTEFTKDGVLYSKCSAAYPTGSLSNSVLRMDKIVPKQVMVGKEYTYQFVVTNLRNTELKNVTITDDINSKYRVIRSQPSAVIDGTKARWLIPSIGAGKQVVVSITGITDNTGTISSCGTVSYDDQVCATTEIVRPGLKAAITAPKSSGLCEIIPLIYTATNVGNIPLTGVYIDGGKTSELVSLDGTRGGQMTIGNLAPGESKQVKVDAKATKEGEFKTVIKAVSGQITSEEASALTMVNAPVLKVSVEAPGKIILGRSFSYDVTVTNIGSGPAANTSISSLLPAGATFISASNGGTLTKDGQVVWPGVNLTPNSSTKLKVTIQPGASSSIRTEAIARTECAQAANAYAQTQMEGISAVLLEVVDLEDPVEVGQNVTYVITATNQGTAPDNEIEIVCNLEPTQQFVSASGATTATSSGSTITFAPLGTLAPKSSATWKVIVKSVSASDTRFKTSMNTKQLGRPVEETEATKSY
jgi:uncharacterized repeat protein (TIGR01451 family)